MKRTIAVTRERVILANVAECTIFEESIVFQNVRGTKKQIEKRHDAIAEKFGKNVDLVKIKESEIGYIDYEMDDSFFMSHADVKTEFYTAKEKAQVEKADQIKDNKKKGGK